MNTFHSVYITHVKQADCSSPRRATVRSSNAQSTNITSVGSVQFSSVSVQFRINVVLSASPSGPRDSN